MLLIVRSTSSWSLGGYVISILCLLVAYLLLIKEVITNFQKYFIERDDVIIFRKVRQHEMTSYTRWTYWQIYQL